MLRRQRDTVTFYRSKGSPEWRWRRVSPNGRKVANGGESYVNRGDCEAEARRVNRRPYRVVTEGQ